jgi:hypothetical protein
MICTLYSGVLKSFGRYWAAYGGMRALASSPYLHVSAVLAALLYPLWHDRFTWCDTSIAVTPSVLGFSLGGYAIILDCGDENFRRAISGTDEDGKPSPFMNANASFIHFILVSTVSVIYAVLNKAWEPPSNILSYLGALLFVYSVATALATAFAVYHVASWYDDDVTLERKSGTQK